ncbi:retrovirus-related pol polyprotein from transposon TNT 1-94 [Tanacetum coccineum]|uniref:Retrovirus-related pol polyprotein from transposon TNT 1-94 n=1 Tax=Tanacetum coccineum TaxID=301880 RepID=A0ABQ5FFQ3_9ASTR
MSSRWNRNVRMALGAKLKLGFIDGSCPKHGAEDANFQRWIRCDYMEIAERYRQNNGPLIYLLGWELRKITQGNLTISSLFNKLKKCWDELQNINGLPTCDYGRMTGCTCDVLVNKAYYIVQQIEKQKQVTNYSFEPTAFFVNLNNKGGNTGRKDNRGSRNDGKKAKKQGRIAANVSLRFNDHFSADTPFDMGYKNEIGTNSGGGVD